MTCVVDNLVAMSGEKLKKYYSSLYMDDLCSVLRIRIRSDPFFFTGSGSVFLDPDPDPT